MRAKPEESEVCTQHAHNWIETAQKNAEIFLVRYGAPQSLDTGN